MHLQLGERAGSLGPIMSGAALVVHIKHESLHARNSCSVALKARGAELQHSSRAAIRLTLGVDHLAAVPPRYMHDNMAYCIVAMNFRVSANLIKSASCWHPGNTVWAAAKQTVLLFNKGADINSSLCRAGIIMKDFEKNNVQF